MSTTSYLVTCFAIVNGSSFDFVSFRAIAYFCPTHPRLYIIISLQGLCHRHGIFFYAGVREYARPCLYFGLSRLAIPSVRTPKHLFTIYVGPIWTCDVCLAQMGQLSLHNIQPSLLYEHPILVTTLVYALQYSAIRLN